MNRYADYTITNLDKLTYAGNLANLKDVESNPNYRFVKGDIADGAFLLDLFKEQRFDAVIHLAAESHVDRSIESPVEFVITNVFGTVNLLNAARATWEGRFEGKRFYHISTDEVYGSLGSEGMFSESTPTIRIVPTRPRKRRRITSSGHSTLLTACRWLSATVRTTTVRTSFPKS